MEFPKGLLKRTKYHLDDMLYRFRDKTPREDVFLYQLKRNGISLPSLNNYLDNAGFPDSIGRFPEMILEYDDIINRVNSYILNFSRASNYRTLTIEKKREYLFRYVAGELAESLSLDPKLFDKYRIKG